jgi:Electron transfer DM13
MSTPPSTARRTRWPVLVALAAVATVAIVVGLWAFQPWKLFTSSTIDEALPTVAAPAQPGADAAQPVQPGDDAQPGQVAPPAQPSSEPQPAPAPQPVVLAEGGFVSQEHPTAGTAKIVQLPDGSRVLRFEGLTTSDGPDLHVWLTDQPANGPWGSYDNGRHVKLGKLKATNGNQNYPIPADAALPGLRSAVIWCDRFNVAFGSAPLAL